MTTQYKNGKQVPGVTTISDRLELHRLLEGRMGTKLTYVWEIYFDGQLVGFSDRKWIAKAIGQAIERGDIAPTGDTTMAYVRWAGQHDRKNFDRLPDNVW